MKIFTDVRVLVNRLLAAEKTLGSGLPFWETDSTEICERWVRPLEIDGEQPGATLVVKAFPNELDLMFRILINAPSCIWRLDFANDEHLNAMDSPCLPARLITEPHYHPWSDNRRHSKENSLPKKLHDARILPDNIRGFVNAFRWFCAETRINVTSWDIPTLPKREKLL